MSRILLVGGNSFLQQTFQKLFRESDYGCVVAAGGEEARTALQGGLFDLVVLEVEDLRSEGLHVLRLIRAQYHIPILLLSARSDISETVSGLDLGADDFLCEPYDPRELMARVRAQLRRGNEYSHPDADGSRIDLGEVVLDTDLRDALRCGVLLGLTRREFDLLHLLARHRGAALASAWIFESVWGSSAVAGGLKALTVYVGRLRRKIETDARHPRLLVSIRGFGYRLNGPAEPPTC